MNEVFVDTLHFAAILNPRDQWHEFALAVESEIGDARLVTTENILHEFLNFFAEFPLRTKKRAADLVNDLYETREIEIIPHTQEIFFDGLRLYESRLDKGYSLTDCMRDERDARARHHGSFDARRTFYSGRFYDFTLKKFL